MQPNNAISTKHQTRYGHVICEDLTILVKTLSERKIFGRTELLIAPVSGTGTKWIGTSRFIPTQGQNAGAKSTQN
jgi:hypothetical protein